MVSLVRRALSFCAPRQSTHSFGFTMIEILVVLTVMGVILGGSITGYTRFNQRQIVLTAGKEFLINVRQAQARATTGVKSNAGCVTLRGYRIAGTANAATYTLTAVCSNTNYTIQTYTLPAGVTVSSTFSITFGGQLGGVQGVSAAGTTIGVRSTALTYTITVNQSGAIIEEGLQ